MSKVLVNNSSLADIAAAIREKNESDTKYKPAEMGAAIREIESGGGDNPLKYAYGECQSLFRNAAFPNDYHLNLTLNGNANKQTFTYWFAYSNIAKLTINLLTVPTNIVLSNIAMGANKLKEVTFVNSPITPSNIYSMFKDCTILEKINGEFDLSNINGIAKQDFEKCYALKEVRFTPNTIKANSTINNSNALSSETIESIINGLADLTGATAATLTLNEIVKAKLTEAQIASITAKNWTLA